MKLNKPRCPKCHNTNVYTRIKTGERVCHTCGYVGKAKEFEVNPNKPKK